MPLTRAIRALAATCLFSSRRVSSLAYDARFRSKVDGLVARRRGDLLVVLEDCTDPANAASIALTGSELENVCTDADLDPSETTLKSGRPLRLRPRGSGRSRLSFGA